MAEPRYTARAVVTGGRQGTGKTDDGEFEVSLKGPVATGGPGGGVNPEQLFAIGYAACFESTLRGAARREKLDPNDTSIKSAVKLMPVETGGANLAVDLDITMPNITDAEVAANLVRQAHENCVYSRAIRNNVDVQFSINGAPVDLGQ